MLELCIIYCHCQQFECLAVLLIFKNKSWGIVHNQYIYQTFLTCHKPEHKCCWFFIHEGSKLCFLFQIQEGFISGSNEEKESRRHKTKTGTCYSWQALCFNSFQVHIIMKAFMAYAKVLKFLYLFYGLSFACTNTFYVQLLCIYNIHKV